MEHVCESQKCLSNLSTPLDVARMLLCHFDLPGDVVLGATHGQKSSLVAQFWSYSKHFFLTDADKYSLSNDDKFVKLQRKLAIILEFFSKKAFF